MILKNKLNSLIDLFIEEKKIVNGLTIPFIIGSYLYLENETYNENTLHKCFNLFFDEDKYFNIHLCHNIRELVVSNIYSEDVKIYLSNDKISKIGNIISTDNSLNNFTTKQDLIEEIKINFESNFNKSLFSKANGLWRNFNQAEIEIINRNK